MLATPFSDGREQENASIFSPNVPIWVSDSTKADTFHCCGNATFEYYQQWRDDPNLCRPGRASPWPSPTFAARLTGRAT